MKEHEPKLPFLMRPVPFFILLALCGPLALILVLIYWQDSPEDRRGPHLMISILFSLLFISKNLPDGLLRILVLSFTYTLVLFLTYSIWGRKRKREKE